MINRQRRRYSKVAGLILAAGMSRRAGDDNKLLHAYEDMALVQHVAQALTDSKVGSVLVVLGHEAHKVEQALLNYAVAVSVNMDYATGLASSLAHGVSLLHNFDAIVVCLGDMPHVDSSVINHLIDAMIEHPEKSFFVPVCKGQRGNPVLITYARFDDVMSLTGDNGARTLMNKYSNETLEVAVHSDAILIDYDTQDELASLNADT